MVKKQSYPVIVLMMLIVGLAVLLLNSPANLELPSVSLGSGSVSSSARVVDAARAEAASVARWQAMAEAYTGQAGARSIEAVTADQARWEAAGEFYMDRGRAADQARWEAAGEFYVDRGRAADQARWEAMGEAYKGLADGK